MIVLFRHIIKTARSVGLHEHEVAAWSIRKDACEQVVNGGNAPIAARVLGHKDIDSRTMNMVYRVCCLELRSVC